jgi:hypothetical protein
VFSPNSSTAYILGANAIAVYRVATFTHLGTFNYTTTFNSLVVSADRSVLYAVEGSAIYVLDGATGAQRQVFALPAPAGGMAGLLFPPTGPPFFWWLRGAIPWIL